VIGAAASVSAASVDVAFVDLTATGETVDGRIGMLAAAALRGGGILAVLTRCRHQIASHGVLVDLTGVIVAAAQNADLLYLQHIVIATGPLLPPQPHPAVSPPAPPERADPDQTAGHDIAHIDLLVFAQPHKSGPRTGTLIPTSTDAADDLGAEPPSAVPVRVGGDAR
jgi:hypothetical protein